MLALLAIPMTLLAKAVLVDVDPASRWIDTLIGPSRVARDHPDVEVGHATAIPDRTVEEPIGRPMPGPDVADGESAGREPADEELVDGESADDGSGGDGAEERR
jgi:hypothetical protein